MAVASASLRPRFGTFLKAQPSKTWKSPYRVQIEMADGTFLGRRAA